MEVQFFFFQTKSLIVVVVNAYKQAHCADMGLYLFVGKAAGKMHAVFAKGWCDRARAIGSKWTF